VSRRLSTSFNGPSLKELLAQARYSGYIQGLEHALDAAETVEEGSVLFAGCNLEGHIKSLKKFLGECREKYEKRFHGVPDKRPALRT
jgi:hypothetical protein